MTEEPLELVHGSGNVNLLINNLKLSMRLFCVAPKATFEANGGYSIHKGFCRTLARERS